MGFPAMRYFSVTPSKFSMATNAFLSRSPIFKDHANIGVIQVKELERGQHRGRQGYDSLFFRTMRHSAPRIVFRYC